MLRRTAVSFFAIVLMACQPIEQGNGDRVTNGTAAGISFQVKTSGWLGLLASCTDAGAGCRTLAAGASTVIASDAIHGFDASMQQVAVVYWIPNQEAPTELLVAY
jgi:hypothetical protein